LRGDTDSEALFALVLDRVDGGADPGDALGQVVDVAVAARVEDPRPSKLNLLLSDGKDIWATRHGNSLYARDRAVASEPWDDDDAWQEVVDGAGVVRIGTD
jgi:glutamine amidotransferase